jgi:hypothetical protein
MSTSDLTGTSGGVCIAVVERPAQGPRQLHVSLVQGTQLSLHTKLGVGLCAIGVALSILLGVSTANADEPIRAPRCAVSLSVAVTPDVPDPSNGGFLSSLLGDHAEYQLFLLSRDDDTHVTLQLQGPGPAERCRAVVDSMRNDGRVQSIQVN